MKISTSFKITKYIAKDTSVSAFYVFYIGSNSNSISINTDTYNVYISDGTDLRIEFGFSKNSLFLYVRDSNNNVLYKYNYRDIQNEFNKNKDITDYLSDAVSVSIDLDTNTGYTIKISYDDTNKVIQFVSS